MNNLNEKLPMKTRGEKDLVSMKSTVHVKKLKQGSTICKMGFIAFGTYVFTLIVKLMCYFLLLQLFNSNATIWSLYEVLWTRLSMLTVSLKSFDATSSQKACIRQITLDTELLSSFIHMIFFMCLLARERAWAKAERSQHSKVLSSPLYILDIKHCIYFCCILLVFAITINKVHVSCLIIRICSLWSYVCATNLKHEESERDRRDLSIVESEIFIYQLHELKFSI